MKLPRHERPALSQTGVAVKRVTIAAMALACCLAAWAAPFATAPRAATAPRTLSVFAAASLAGAFGEIAGEFERTHPGLHVQINLAGTQQLAAQIEQGARTDVFAAADDRWMKYLEAQGRLAGAPANFARNRLVVILPRTNPARIARLQDLARRGVKLVIGAETVPVGRYAREMFEKLANSPDFDAAYSRRILSNVVSEEENVKLVVGRVQLGEADAGVCYRSDVTPAIARYVSVIEIPEASNVLAVYPIATLAAAPRAAEAAEFIAAVLSAKGQRALERHGLIPVAAAP